jgi:uncharacterized membrane protein YccC
MTQSTGWPAALLRDVTTFDRSKVGLCRAARNAAGASIPLVLGAATGHVAPGLMCSIGAVNLAPFDQPSLGRDKASWMALATVAVAIAAMAGGVSGNSPWLPAILVSIGGFATGLIVTASPAAFQTALGSLIVFIVLTYQPQPLPVSLGLGGLVLAGGFLETMVAQIAWPRESAVPKVETKGARTPLRVLITEFHPEAKSTSPAFDHAVRLGACLAVADGIARLLHLDHGYWIPMTAALVLTPEVASTLSRTVSRLVGTGGGLVTGSLLEYPVRGHLWLHVVLFAVVAFAILAIGPANYTLLVALITSLVVLMLSLSGLAPSVTVPERALYSLIGGLIVLTCFLWPFRGRELSAKG